MIGWEAGDASVPVAVVIGTIATMSVYILTPAFLYLQDLFGRHFGRFAEGRALVPARMRILAVGVGNSFVACTSFLMVQGIFIGTVTIDAWVIWASILAYAGAVSYVAYTGFAASVQPLEEALETLSSDVRLLQPRSLDEVGAMMYRLKELLEASAAAQRGLRAGEARLRMFAEAASDYFFELDSELRFSYFSDRFREITGLDPDVLIGRHALEMRDEYRFEYDTDRPANLAAHRPYRDFRFTVRDRSGKPLHMQSSAVPYFDEAGRFCGYRGTGANITEMVEAQKALRVNQAELAQAQKMEAVGQLTGGIAHDFNNLLTVILGNLELLNIHAADQPKLLRHIESAMTAATRGGALTQRLLAFSRRQALHPVPLDVAERLRAMEELLDRTLGEDIRIEVVAEQGLWKCMVDPHQLESAILNLALNARDAMPNGGNLSMKLDNCRGLSGITSTIDGPNDYVRLRIADTGRGIAPDVLPHVFEPFFTTKGPGEGSGLGLSMVYGFINQSGGRIVLTSVLGLGTTAEILLPRALDGAEVADDPMQRETRVGQGQTIMVIEDDPGVTAVITEGLRQLGYQVVNVTNGEQALDCLGERKAIDLVLSDIVLPGGLSGLDVEEAMRKVRPGVRFIFMSGYAQDEIARKGPRMGKGLPGIDILRKPFQLTDLADRVIEALAADA
jgi:PAS domain S-box-containing protein